MKNEMDPFYWINFSKKLQQTLQKHGLRFEELTIHVEKAKRSRKERAQVFIKFRDALNAKQALVTLQTEQVNFSDYKFNKERSLVIDFKVCYPMNISFLCMCDLTSRTTSSITLHP